MASKIIEEDIEDIAKNIENERSKLSGKTVLITGGAGFLGNYFISVIDHLNKNILEKPCREGSLGGGEGSDGEGEGNH